jgi:hypothetical protein
LKAYGKQFARIVGGYFLLIWNQRFRNFKGTQLDIDYFQVKAQRQTNVSLPRTNTVAVGTKENGQFQIVPVVCQRSKYISMLRDENKVEGETEV